MGGSDDEDTQAPKRRKATQKTKQTTDLETPTAAGGSTGEVLAILGLPFRMLGRFPCPA